MEWQAGERTLPLTRISPRQWRQAMKRLVMACLGVFLLVSSAQALTIEAMELYAGKFDSNNVWGATGALWNTYHDTHWVLGVSQVAGGPLLNHSNTTISGLDYGTYYLYAEPATINTSPKLVIHWSDSTTTYAIFSIVGANGSGTAWTWKAGDPNISLGWASGTANLVGSQETMTPSGNNDFYMVTEINSVPLPGAIWLLGAGLLGLAGWQRKKIYSTD